MGRADPGRQLGLQEAAARLGVHYMTVYRYVRTGRLPAVKVDGEWRVEAAAVDRLHHPPAPAARRRGRGRAAARLEQRLVVGDELGAWAVAEEALAAGARPADVYLDLLAPALRSVGDRWERGELDVADEHRAAVTARRVMGRLGPRFARPGRKRGVVVLGAVAGERHELPVAMVADLLREAGFELVDFGADTPAASFAGAARRYRPVAVVIGATGPGHEGDLAEAVRAVRAVSSVPVLVGGPAVAGPPAARALGADGWTGPDAAAVVQAVEQVAAAG